MKHYRSFTCWIEVLLCLSLLVGCAQPVMSEEESRAYFQPVSSIAIPENATLVGLGEATHGNAEFVRIRLEVFQELVERYGYRTIAIEGDFGGSQVVNAYILEGFGTAVDAVRQIGFAIYKTQEMVNLIEWIYQYNQSVSQDQKIHFYGFDMQRYDHNIEGLLAYTARVDPEKVETYRAALVDLNDETVFNQSREKIQAGLKAIGTILSDMQQNQDRYVAATSQADFDLAYQYATCVQENATLRGTDVVYTEQRDQYMAQKVAWIVEYEKSQGRDRVFLAGHNGHIEKSSASPLYRSMGSRLAEIFAEQYFAIGTEFYKSTFNCKDANSGERKQFSVKNGSEINRVFLSSGMDTAYVDIQQAMTSHTFEKLLNTSQPMSNIGDEFSGLYRFVKAFYTLKMVPAQAYDGIVFVREATPTTMLED